MKSGNARFEFLRKSLLGTHSFNIQTLSYILFSIYLTALATFYFIYGELFQLSLGVLYLLAAPVFVLFERWKGFFKDSFAFITLLLSYEALQGLVGSIASSHSIFSIYSVDGVLWGFNLTGWVQSHLQSVSATTIALVFYGLHFPLVLGASVLFWLTNKPVYRSYVNAILITSFAALTMFLLLPIMPPWYQGTAQNLVLNGSSSLSGFGGRFTQLMESDKFAAFPSLHSAYVTTFSYFAIKLRPLLAFVGIPLVLGVAVSAMYLGQHYLVDLLGGAALSLVSCHFVGRHLQFTPRLCSMLPGDFSIELLSQASQLGSSSQSQGPPLPTIPTGAGVPSLSLR